MECHTHFKIPGESVTGVRRGLSINEEIFRESVPLVSGKQPSFLGTFDFGSRGEKRDSSSAYSSDTPLVLLLYSCYTPPVLPVLPSYSSCTSAVLLLYSSCTPLVLHFIFWSTGVALFPPCFGYIEETKDKMKKSSEKTFGIPVTDSPRILKCVWHSTGISLGRVFSMLCCRFSLDLQFVSKKEKFFIDFCVNSRQFFILRDIFVYLWGLVDSSREIFWIQHSTPIESFSSISMTFKVMRCFLFDDHAKLPRKRIPSSHIRTDQQLCSK